MAQRRVGEVSLTFDSMTDLVTNLAGGLILLVLLLAGLTRGSARQARGGPEAPESEVLAEEVAALEQILAELRRELPKRKAEAAELRQQAASQQPREAADPEGVAGRPAVIEVRPPMVSNEDNRAPRGMFVVRKGRLFCLDLDGFEAEYDALLERPPGAGDGPRRTLRSGDFDVIFALERGVLVGTLASKPDAVGETVEQARRSDSRYRMVLNNLDPDRHFVTYFVYPDGFEQLHEFREVAQARGLRCGWQPKSAGDEVLLVRGGGGGGSGNTLRPQ